MVLRYKEVLGYSNAEPIDNYHRKAHNPTNIELNDDVAVTLFSSRCDCTGFWWLFLSISCPAVRASSSSSSSRDRIVQVYRAYRVLSGVQTCRATRGRYWTASAGVKAHLALWGLAMSELCECGLTSDHAPSDRSRVSNHEIRRRG